MFYYAERNFLTDLQYRADVYLRENTTSKRRGWIVRYLPWMAGTKRCEQQGITEMLLQFQFHPFGQRDVRIRALHSSFENAVARTKDEVADFNFFIYGTNLFSDRVLNPLNRRNKRFYRYRLSYTTQFDSFRVAHIDITPRFENEQLVKSGSVEVDLTNGAVRKFTFSIFSEMRSFFVSGRTGTGYYDSVLPVKMRIVTRFKFLGSRLAQTYDLRAQYHFSCPLKFGMAGNRGRDVTDKCFLRVDTSHVLHSAELFDSIRPFPLREDEKALFKASAEQLAKANLPAVAPNHTAIVNDSISESMARGEWKTLYAIPEERSVNAAQRTKDLLLSSRTMQLGATSRLNLRLPAVVTPSMLQWSHSKGFSVKTRVQLSAPLPAIDGSFSLSPQVGYNFKQRQVYWDVPLHFAFWPRMDAAFHVEAGGGQHMYSSRQADEVRHRLMSTEKPDSILHIIDHYGFDDYRDLHLKADWLLSPHPSLRLSLGVRLHKRTMICWNQTAAENGMHRTLGSFAPRLQAAWTPGTFYYRNGKRRIPLHSPYPTFLFNYERAFSTSAAETRYERFEGDVRYRLSLYALRSLSFRAGFGTYTRRGRDCFIDYDFFRFNNMPDGWDDGMMGQFQLLSSRWYNESSYYAMLTSSYQSPMLLFSRIPWLTHFIRTERLYCNLLSVKTLKWYGELGYGISTNILDLGVFFGVAKVGHFDAGVKCALRLFGE